MFGASRLIFAFKTKLELGAETLILHSGPKFLCFVVHLYKYFWFWYQTEIMSEKDYAVIWPVIEITSLKWDFCIKFRGLREWSWGSGDGGGDECKESLFEVVPMISVEPKIAIRIGVPSPTFKFN